MKKCSKKYKVAKYGIGDPRNPLEAGAPGEPRPNVFVQRNAYATGATEDAAMTPGFVPAVGSEGDPSTSMAGATPAAPENISLWDKFLDPTRTDFHPFFKAFNPIAQIATGIGATVNNHQAARNEQKQYLKAIQPTAWENMERYGLNSNPVFTKYGGVAQTVEAEKGEVYKDMEGNVNVIPDDAPTHEQGGVIIPDAHRVLENTSTMRGDTKSKYLKLSPQDVKSITGIKTSKSMSHAEAMKKVLSKVELTANDENNYAANSTKLNMSIFDKLFGHQETLKAEAGIKNGVEAKYGIGQPINPIDKYKNAKTPEGGRTPTGRPNKYSRGADHLEAWEQVIPGISKLDNKQAQAAMYDYMLKSDEGKGRLSEMWRSYGLTKEGFKYKDLVAMTDGKGVFNPNKELDDNQLSSLKRAFTDGFFGDRQFNPFVEPPTMDIPTTTPKDDPDRIPQEPLDTSIIPPTLTQNRKSEFHEPLRWFDVASPIGAYMNALERLPEKYNPAQFNQLRYKLQDPTAALQQNQADFRASTDALAALPLSGGVRAANIANLNTSKYAANNKLLGDYENDNAKTKNAEITYNTQVRDRQSLSDQQSREVFEDKVLTSKAKQDEQKLVALDSLYKTFAENRALNRNGNLVMKFSNAFDQYGDYNGYKYNFQPNPALGANVNTAFNANKLSQYKAGDKIRIGKQIYYFDGQSLTPTK